MTSLLQPLIKPRGTIGVRAAVTSACISVSARAKIAPHRKLNLLQRACDHWVENMSALRDGAETKERWINLNTRAFASEPMSSIANKHFRSRLNSLFFFFPLTFSIKMRFIFLSNIFDQDNILHLFYDQGEIFSFYLYNIFDQGKNSLSNIWA